MPRDEQALDAVDDLAELRQPLGPVHVEQDLQPVQFLHERIEHHRVAAERPPSVAGMRYGAQVRRGFGDEPASLIVRVHAVSP